MSGVLFSTSFDGFNYVVIFIDDFSRVIWVYLLKTKSENIFGCFKDFHMLVTTQFSALIKSLRSNNDIENMTNDMTLYLSSNGILHQSSCVGTPQQNRIVEHKNHRFTTKKLKP